MWRAVLLTCLASAASAETLSLSLPMECGDENEACHIQNYVDLDPGDGWSDYACGKLTYDGHKGTDFALPTMAWLSRGWDVYAAAPGTVRGTRDGMPDILISDPDAPDLDGRDCGNGVVIDHGNGWETQYCHLARGSIAVSSGQTVSSGHILGRVGLSGRTEFPHLHFSLRRDGEVVDPFDPDGVVTCGAPSDGTLWDTPRDWARGGLLDIGFATRVPEFDEIKAGAATEEVASDSPAMVVFALMFGSQPGDILTLRIAGPDGEVFANSQTLERAQAQLFRAGGRRTPSEGWSTGVYIGTASLIRDGAVISERALAVEVN